MLFPSHPPHNTKVFHLLLSVRCICIYHLLLNSHIGFLLFLKSLSISFFLNLFFVPVLSLLPQVQMVLEVPVSHEFLLDPKDNRMIRMRVESPRNPDNSYNYVNSFTSKPHDSVGRSCTAILINA